MTVRTVHFVGSYPGTDSRGAMRAMIEGTNGNVECIPDGEIWNHGAWLSGQMRALKDRHDAIMVTREGDYQEIERFPCLGVRPGRESEFTGDSLAALEPFDYVGRATRARAVLNDLSDEFDRPFTLQQGLPHCLDMAFLAFSPSFDTSTREPPYVGVFAEHLHRQIHATIAAIGADQVLFQINSQFVLPHHLEGCGQFQGASPGETLANVINRATPQVRFGVRLGFAGCGATASMPGITTTAAVVDAVEELADALERPESLEYVQFALAAGRASPPVQAEVYRPLARLRELVPAETRFITGFADERQSLHDQLRVRDLVEEAIGEPVDIAAACGLRRHTPAEAERVVARMLELAGG